MLSRSDNVTVSKLRVESCTRASHWSIIDVEESQNLMLEDVQCMNNVNTVGPSCISIWSSEVTLNKLRAQNNWGGKGGVLRSSYSDVAFVNGVFRDNQANFSGGVGHFENCNLAMTSTIIDSNRASDGGGAITIQVMKEMGERKVGRRFDHDMGEVYTHTVSFGLFREDGMLRSLVQDLSTTFQRELVEPLSSYSR